MIISTLGKCHLLPQEGLLESGGREHKIVRDKRRNTKNFPLKMGTEDFHEKDFLGFIIRLY